LLIDGVFLSISMTDNGLGYNSATIP